MQDHSQTLLAVAIYATVLCSALATTLFEGASLTPRPKIGTTLPGIFGVNSTCPWVNIMKCALPLQWQQPNGGYVNPATIALDPQTGLPRNMTFPTVLGKTALQSGLDGHYEAGIYDLTFEGNGTITVAGDAAPPLSSSSNGSLTFQVVQPTNVGIILFLNASHGTNPVTSITVVCRAVAAAATTRWHPTWLALLKGNFSLVRMSHWQQESYNYYTTVAPVNWSLRPAVTRFTQVWSDGVSHEDIAALAIDAEVDLVLSVPQRANEEYLTSMAAWYASTVGAHHRKLYVVDSYQNGYIAVPTRRIDRIVQIARVFREAYAAAQRIEHLEVVLMLDLMSGECMPYFTPSSAQYNSTLAASIDAVAASGDIIVGSIPYSTVVPNPYFAAIAPVLNDTRRIAWERMIKNEADLVAYVSKWAILNYSFYALEGGLTLATDMFGERFEHPTSVEAAIMVRLEASMWSYERSNPSELKDLWTEWLERMYRVGLKVVLAGHFITKGIACDMATTHLTFANRYQCSYRGLAPYIDAVPLANKWAGVVQWVRNTTPPGYVAALVDAPAGGLEAPLCTNNSTCVWGLCNNAGACVCDNGYQGADCSTFNASLLANLCSPDDYGVNLGGGADWEPSWIWTNFMNFARTWIHQPVSGYVWSFDEASIQRPALSNDGYPLRLEPDHAMSTFLRRDTYEYPHGIFHFFYEGDGTFTFGMDTHLVRYVRNGYYILETKPVRQLNNGLYFQIRRTNPDNPVRNIHVVPDAQLGRHKWQPFHPLYLESLKAYRIIRFMAMQHVQSDLYSNISARTWSTRTMPTYYSQVSGRDGISIEYVVRLCNQLHARPWINIPYNADDDYVVHVAEYLRAHLNPRLQPIVEYSNEVWASDGYAGYYAQTQAVLLGLDSGSSVVRARACWNQHRSRQIWRIMRSHGVNCTRVLGAQAAYTGPLLEALACNASVATEIDAVGIAPYFGISLVSDTRLLTAEEVFSRAQDAINASAGMVANHRTIAAQHNISNVFCYEAGPSYFGGASSSDPDIVALGFKIHRDPRMAGIVEHYFDALRASGATSANMYFTAPAGKWSGYGAWGIREYQNQDPSTAFKVQGFAAYASANRNPQCPTTPIDNVLVHCPSNCSGRGTCMPDGTCECYFAFRGANCSEHWTIPDFDHCNAYLCPQYGGSCQISSRDGNYDLYTCVGCGSNRTGWMCQYPVCPNNCSYAGTCASNNTCQCFRGRTGASCNVSCNCGGHGDCAMDGSLASCVCDAGYRFDGTTCVAVCACDTCQGPNLCGCSRACLYGACYNGTCLCWAGFGGATCTVLAGNRSTNSESVMGINVAGIADWSNSIEFLNLMWRSREWFLRPADVVAPSTRWSVNEPLTLTSDGYPALLPFDRIASTFVTRDTTFIPAGVYTVLWDGTGILDCEFDATIIPSTRAVGYMRVSYAPTTVLNNGFLLTIRATDPADPIRNIRVYSPEHPEDAVAKSLVFHPRYLADLAPFRTVRFMDWANLGMLHPGVSMGSFNRTWDKRNSLNASSMATGFGVNEELMIALANWLNVEPWFSIPHDATDDYVRRLAVLIKYKLRPDVAIHIEHSNEVWNGFFESFKYSAARGRIQFPDAASDFEAAVSWHGYRSQQIFSIFQTVFGSLQRNRLRFKVGTFALSEFATRTAMRHVTSRPVWVSSTGYFCDEASFGGAAAAAVLSIDALIERCLNLSTVNDSNIVRQAAVARELNAGLDLYESGPSLVEMSAIFSGYSQPGVPAKYRAFHLDSRMRTIVKNFYTMQRALGVDQFNYFTSAAKTSIYGNWGIKESTTQSCTSAPKCRGTMEWLEANKDPNVRTVKWGLADFGFNNVVRGTFTTAPTAQQLLSLVAALEQAMNLTAGSIVAEVETTNATAAAAAAAALSLSAIVAQGQHRAFRSLASGAASGNTTVLFIVSVAQASSTNVSDLSATVGSSIAQVAASSTGLEMTANIVVASSVIAPGAEIPAGNDSSDDNGGSGPPPPPATAASTSSDSNVLAIGIGAAGGGLLFVAAAVLVGRRCSDQTMPPGQTAVETFSHQKDDDSHNLGNEDAHGGPSEGAKRTITGHPVL